MSRTIGEKSSYHMMKFGEEGFVGLGLGAGMGFVATSLLSRHSGRGGFASPGNDCPWACHSVPTCAEAWACVGKCDMTGKLTAHQMTHLTGPMPPESEVFRHRGKVLQPFYTTIRLNSIDWPNKPGHMLGDTFTRVWHCNRTKDRQTREF